MPSTYSPSLKIELIGNGEQSGTWGQTTNNNMGTLIEQAIAGVEPITLTGNKTLTSFNGLSDEARNAVLVFNGSLAAPANVIAPAVQKTYIITNNSGANVTIKTATGNGVTIINGLNSLVYCDGDNFFTAVSVNNVVGDLSVSGNEFIGGNISIGSGSIAGPAGNLTMTSNSNIISMTTNTGAFIPPTGTTAQRPSTPALGMSRWNSDLGVYEIWNGIIWQVIASGGYTATYLVVSGGGGGGANPGGGGAGGGGAGGYVTGTTTFVPGNTYSFVIGAGGASGTNGNVSSITGIVNAAAGGAGGNINTAGSAGGSGGGGGSAAGGGAPASYAGGSGTSGQGFAGGSGANNDFPGNGGGGGGAGAVGGNGPAGGGSSGAGGIGILSTITGASVYYAGGGGGAGFYGNGAGGLGGGGAGSTNGVAGTANRGGGGGGGNTGVGGTGGSGVVIISVPTSNYSNVTTGSPTVVINGSNTVMTFTSSGTYTT